MFADVVVVGGKQFWIFNKDFRVLAYLQGRNGSSPIRS